MKIKVCGMRETENIRAIQKMSIDFMGFIFYPKSKRFVGENFIIPNQFNDEIKKVGVFVDHNINEVVDLVATHSLDYVQLHGNENTSYIQELSERGIKIIKATGIKEGFNFGSLKAFQPYVNYFLFDTSTSQYGGSGLKFDWQILNDYTLETTYLLSGGIGPGDVEPIMGLYKKDERLLAIDVNSRFEIQPALKNVELLKDFVKKIKTSYATSEE